MKRALVDFNCVRDDCVPALQEYANAPLCVGDRILAYESDEDAAMGVVEDVSDRGLVRIRIDWATFGSRTDAEVHG